MAFQPSFKIHSGWRKIFAFNMTAPINPRRSNMRAISGVTVCLFAVISSKETISIRSISYFGDQDNPILHMAASFLSLKSS